MKLKFRYDYNHSILVITFLVSVGILAAGMFCLLTVVIAQLQILTLSVLLLIIAILSLLNSLILIRRQGIELDMSKERILIIDNYFVRKININDLASAEYKEIAKTKGNPFIGIFAEPRCPGVYKYSSCDHVYHNGKVYQIIFHLRDGTSIESYFGWMYKEKSEKVVQKVEYELNVFLKQLNEAIPWKKPFRKS